MAEEVTAVLRMSKDGTTFGFLLRQIDVGEHVIYKIIENTPADMCAKVEIGDIVMKINGVDVTGLATKDVVKCVRVSPNPMTLQLKKDPQVKGRVYEMIKSTSPERVLHGQMQLQLVPPLNRGPEEYTVVLQRRKDEKQLGFVVRATDLLDHVIVEIRKDSPAALCGKVEVGDVFLKINDTDAQQYSPRDVLKCLGLATEPITLRMKRDPWIKKYLREQYQHEEPHLVLSDDSIESQSHKATSDGTNGSGSPALPASRIAQPKRSKLLSLDSEPNLNSPGSGGGRPAGNGNPYAVRECLSESACRPSRIPQAIGHSNWSAPQSPSRGRKPSRASQIPTPRSELIKHTRFVMTGESQFETRYGDTMTTTSVIKEVRAGARHWANNPLSTLDSALTFLHTFSQPHPENFHGSPNSQRFVGGVKRKNAPLVNYDTLSSSTSRSDENTNSSSSCLMEDNANNDATQPPSPASPLSPTDGPAASDNSNGGEGPASKTKPPAGTSNHHGSNGNNNLPASCSNGESDEADRRDGDGSSGNQNANSNAKAAGGGAGGNGGRGGVAWVIDCDSSNAGSNRANSMANARQRRAGDPSEISYSVPTSPVGGGGGGGGVGGGGGGLGNEHHHHHHHHHHHLLSAGNEQHRNNNEMSINSLPTSPEYGGAAGGGGTGGGGQQQVFRYGAGSGTEHSANGGAGGGDMSSGELTGHTNMGSASGPASGVIRKCDAAGFRTSRSEDHLQQTQRDGGIGAVVSIDIDEDVNSSLNTLLDTRHDSQEYALSERERFLWSYNTQTNAPKTGGSSSGGEHGAATNAPETGASVVSPQSYSSSVSSSPQRSASDSPASPTSVSSSDEHDLLSTKDLMAMAISDPSDSDSTILISESTHRCDLPMSHPERDHKLVIQVKSSEGGASMATDAEEDYDGARCLALLQEAERSELDSFDSMDDGGMMLQPGGANMFQPPAGHGDMTYGGSVTRESSPPVSDDGSDVDSLHSFHYSPKAVDLPSAERLAKRLYYLEGFKKSDVSRHLCKNNDFSRAVAEEYLKFFFFECLTLDKALRLFLKQFSLTGETQERERVLVHFSKRYLDCNPRSFNSQDAVHTLTCAIMLLNTDLHGQNIGSKMTCAEFIDNLSDLNDGENFPKNVLKQLYYSIKEKQLEWALDDETDPKSGNRNNDGNGNGGNGNGLDGNGDGGGGESGPTGGSLQGPPVGPNPFLEAPRMFAAVEYKKGYVMRKCCYDTNYKKTPFGRRSWKMFFCTLRDLVLYLHKDEHGFRRNQMSDNVHNAIRIHHALASRANDYTKKQHVFRLQTADQSEFLFQTSDSKELQSWIDTINFVCASFSAPPLEGGVGSQKRFQRPLLPCTHSRLLLLKRYKTYYNLLSSRLTMEPQDFNSQHQVSAAALNDTGERRDDSTCSMLLPLDGGGGGGGGDGGYDYGAISQPAPVKQRPTGGNLMPHFIQQHQGTQPAPNATGRPGLSPPDPTALGQLPRLAAKSTNSL
uniref:PH and SEC7 domain-containing protein 4 n=1 Tax=Anopheles epiroticus TaxID=199890 RepID=A0A182P6T8_9DIPT